MKRIFLRVAAICGLALIYGSSLALAGAVSSSIGELVDAMKPDNSIVHVIRGGHGHGGHHGGGHMSVSRGGGSFAFSGGRHRHHRARVFVGSSYYGYYDDCWYSRRYGRWVCPNSY